MSSVWNMSVFNHRCRRRYIVKRLYSQSVRCSPLELTDARDIAYARIYWKRRKRRALNTSLEEDVREWRRRLR